METQLVFAMPAGKVQLVRRLSVQALKFPARVIAVATEVASETNTHEIFLAFAITAGLETTVSLTCLF